MNMNIEKPDMVTHTYNPRIQEAEAERLPGAQGQPNLHSKYQAGQGYTSYTLSPKNKTKQKCLNKNQERIRIQGQGRMCA